MVSAAYFSFLFRFLLYFFTCVCLSMSGHYFSTAATEPAKWMGCGGDGGGGSVAAVDASSPRSSSSSSSSNTANERWITQATAVCQCIFHFNGLWLIFYPSWSEMWALDLSACMRERERARIIVLLSADRVKKSESRRKVRLFRDQSREEKRREEKRRGKCMLHSQLIPWLVHTWLP